MPPTTVYQMWLQHPDNPPTEQIDQLQAALPQYHVTFDSMVTVEGGDDLATIRGATHAALVSLWGDDGWLRFFLMPD
jgi:hypothetical protein